MKHNSGRSHNSESNSSSKDVNHKYSNHSKQEDKTPNSFNTSQIHDNIKQIENGIPSHKSHKRHRNEDPEAHNSPKRTKHENNVNYYFYLYFQYLNAKKIISNK